MPDTTLQQHLLGGRPLWTVAKVELDVTARRVDVWVEHPTGLPCACPECGALASLHDHAAECVWRYVDSCPFQSLRHPEPPRVTCPEHAVRQVRLPWTEPHARFTVLFEAFAIQMLRETSIQASREIFRFSRDEAWCLMHRTVDRGMARKKPRLMPYLGVDEKATDRGQTNYVTIVCDLTEGMVEEVSEGREKRRLKNFLDGLTPKQREAVQAVAMDMCDAQVYAVPDTLPEGQRKIVVDRFHITKPVGEAVDTARCQENKDLLPREDESLVGTRCVWLHAPENLPSRY